MFLPSRISTGKSRYATKGENHCLMVVLFQALFLLVFLLGQVAFESLGVLKPALDTIRHYSVYG
jgi:hypothetical protein